MTSAASADVFEAINQKYVQEIIEHVAKDNDITNWHITEQKFESLAQNYFGVLIPIVLTGEVNGKELSLYLVVKFAPTDERFRVSGALTLFFAREIFVYSKLLRKYKELQEAFPAALQYVTPKCYFVREDYCKEVIVMENLCVEGYKPFTEEMFLDLEHLKLSLKSLAKFHALSFILEKNDPIFYKEVTEKCVPLNEKNNKRFIEILKDRLNKAIQKFEDTLYETLFLHLNEKCVEFVEATAFGVKGTSICHGDMWKENIMFKYQDQKPISACLIDYQTARMSCPAFDVLYLITTSSKSELRSQHFQDLLHIYYETFENVLSQANFNNVYSRSDFDHDLKVVAPGCLIIANTAFWLSSGLQEEGHVRSKRVATTDEEKTNAVAYYKRTVQGVVDDLRKYGYLCFC